jgi:hypothetical protein
MEWDKSQCSTSKDIQMHNICSHTKKLDDISEKCIFTGYSETYKAYRLYNPITKKLILSRDVKFLENQIWNDSENQ